MRETTGRGFGLYCRRTENGLMLQASGRYPASRTESRPRTGSILAIPRADASRQPFAKASAHFDPTAAEID